MCVSPTFHQDRIRQVLAGVTDKGQTVEELRIFAPSIRSRKNVYLLLNDMAKKGLLFFCVGGDGLTSASRRFFLTVEARDAMRLEIAEWAKIKRRERERIGNNKRREARAEKRAAAPPKVKSIPIPKPPKAKPVKVVKIKPAKPPKPVKTKPAVIILTASQKPKPKPSHKYGAFHPGEPDISQAKITKAETPKPRFHVPDDFTGAFSAMKIGSYFPQASCAARSA